MSEKKEVQAPKQTLPKTLAMAEVTNDVNLSYPFRSPRNSKSIPRQYEINTKPSETIPHQSLSVTELLQRYANGLPLEGVRIPIYNGEEHLPNFDKLDLSERQELIKANQQEIKDLQEKAQRAKNPTKTKNQPEAKPDEKNGPDKAENEPAT